MADEEDVEYLFGWAGGELLSAWEVPPLPGQLDQSSYPLGGPVSDRVYIVTATLYPDWTNQTPVTSSAVASTGSHPIASFPFGTTVAGPGPVELRLSDIDMTTSNVDTLYPATFFDGRVKDPGTISFTLPLTPVGSSAIEAKIGSVVIDNSDGKFDTLLDTSSATSQAIRIRGGRRGWDIGTFVTLFNARITAFGLSETEATLELQDLLLYAQNQYPTTVFTGLGGINGDTELEGVVKPVVLGRVWNMSPVLINATSLIYMLHDGAITSVIGVYDGGVALTFSANYDSYSALAAASLSGGQYATCLAAGLVRVGGTPAYALTAYLDGSNLAGNTIRSIVTRLLDQLSTQLGISTDAGSLSTLPGWVAGWMWTEPFTYLEAISRFVGDGGCHWGTDANGAVRVLQLLAPSDASVAAEYDMHDIISIERAVLPQGYEGVHQRRQVQFQRNWTVQSDSDLAAAAATRAGRQREWRTALSTVAVTSRNAIDPDVLQTSLASATDAATLGATMLGLHGVTRQSFSMETRVQGPMPKIGETVRITYPRFGLAGGMLFRVIGRDLRLADDALQLLLWG